MLRELGNPRELLDAFADGRIKLHVTRTGLQLRAQERLLFLEGTYRPIDGGDHVVAFERVRGGTRLVCVAPRLPYTLTQGKRAWPIGDVWGDQAIEIADGTYKNAFTGEQVTARSGRVLVREALATFPVAWLVCST